MRRWIKRTVLAGILLLVVAVVFPMFTQSRGSRIDYSIVHLKGMAIALSMYAQDHQGVLPPMQNPEVVKQNLASYAVYRETPFGRKEVVKKVLSRYGVYLGTSSGQTDSALTDPDSGKPFQPNPFLSGKSLNLCKPDAIAFYSETLDRYGFYRCVTLDGHLQNLDKPHWASARRSFADVLK